MKKLLCPKKCSCNCVFTYVFIQNQVGISHLKKKKGFRTKGICTYFDFLNKAGAYNSKLWPHWQHIIYAECGIACGSLYVTWYMISIHSLITLIGNMNIIFVYVAVCIYWCMYLFIGFWNQAANAAVTLKEVLKLFFTDNKSLCFSKAVLSCIFPVNQQALKHLIET